MTRGHPSNHGAGGFRPQVAIWPLIVVMKRAASDTCLRSTSTAQYADALSIVRNFSPPDFFFIARANTPKATSRVAVIRDCSSDPDSRDTLVTSDSGIVSLFNPRCNSIRSLRKMTLSLLPENVAIGASATQSLNPMPPW